jgi:hypothetical protein
VSATSQVLVLVRVRLVLVVKQAPSRFLRPQALAQAKVLVRLGMRLVVGAVVVGAVVVVEAVVLVVVAV